MTIDLERVIDTYMLHILPLHEAAIYKTPLWKPVKNIKEDRVRTAYKKAIETQRGSNP